jgi:hypothetical protein
VSASSEGKERGAIEKTSAVHAVSPRGERLKRAQSGGAAGFDAERTENFETIGNIRPFRDNVTPFLGPRSAPSHDSADKIAARCDFWVSRQRMAGENDHRQASVRPDRHTSRRDAMPSRRLATDPRSAQGAGGAARAGRGSRTSVRSPMSRKIR